MKVCMIDVETTGTDSQSDVLLEIGGGIIETNDEVYAGLTLPFRILIVPTNPLKVPLRVLSMHSTNKLWETLGLADDEMRKDNKEVIQRGDRSFCLRQQHAWSVFQEMMKPFKDGARRLVLGGKNVEFDLRFLRGMNKGIDDYFMARKADPGILWVNESDDRVPSLKECVQRTKAMFPPPPGTEEGMDHTSLADCRSTAWALKGGLRRLFGKSSI